MPQVRYVGPFSEVVLPTLGIETVPGGVVDVDDESFANLVEQHDWEAVAPTKKSAKAEPAADAENGEPQ